MKKKLWILAAVMICCTVFAAGVSAAAWDGTAAGGFAGGTGTEADPYRIATAQQLAYLAQSVNSGTTYAGQYIRLTADIVMNDTSAVNWMDTAKKWTPIGSYTDDTASAPFSGTFDGGGYTISGLYIRALNGTEWLGYQGLFGYTYNANFKNVTVANADITGADYVGALVGYAEYYAKDADAAYTLSGCTVKNSTILGEEHVGGLAGFVYGYAEGGSSKNRAALTLTIDLCSNSETSVTGGTGAGGVVGGYKHEIPYGSYAEIPTAFTNCSNSGDISAEDTSYAHSGGIAGYSYSSDTVFTNCSNSGDISASVFDFAYMGGITGYSDYSTVFTNCTNSGDVFSSGYDSYAGGITGYGDYSTVFTNCSNSGDVSGGYAGGLIGDCYSHAAFTNCMNSGGISGSCAGGLAGYCDTSAVFTGCTNSGDVSGDSIAGGNAGYCSSSATFTDCTNSGDVSASSSNSDMGGIVGFVDSGSIIENCCNTGSMPTPAGTASFSDNAGGIVGSAVKSVIRNCFNTGTFYGYQNVGGIVGYLESDTSTPEAFIINCYTLGGVNGMKKNNSTPATYIGAVVGRIFGEAQIASCYYLGGCAADDLGNIQNGIGSSDCSVPTADVPGTTVACTDAQLKQQSTFAGFDFTTVWMMGDSDYPYPVFKTVKTYTIRGSITSFGEGNVTVSLLRDGAAVEEVTVTVTADSYEITGVPAGTYTMRISKPKHVPRDYTVTVGTP